MDAVISQIHTLSTNNDGDLKKLRDFLKHEQENIKANAQQIDQALQTLDPVQNTLGVAYLLAAQVNTGIYANQRETFTYIGSFLKVADENQVKKASVPFIWVCKSYAQMALDDGQQATLRSIVSLRMALEKLRPNPETLTPVHAEFVRVCLKSKAYHLATPVLNLPIFDISLSNNNCSQMTPQSFLCYFYYGALVRIGTKEFSGAIQFLLVALTCPASCLSAIQADAYKKYVLVSLIANGELPTLPIYCSHIVQRYAKMPGYALDIVEAFTQGDIAALRSILEEKAPLIKADNNMGLAKQVLASQQRHKVQTLTKTYLTLSLDAIASEVAMEGRTREVEELLFDMISSGEISARIDQSTGNVAFSDDIVNADVGQGMVLKLQEQMHHVLELAQRLEAFETEVVSSEAYVRKTSVLDRGSGGGAGAVPLETVLAERPYDFMDM